jgi:uncharacterized membrane protein
MSRNKFLRLHRRNKKILTLGLIIISVAIVGVTIYRGPIVQAFTLATTHQPETYTELYFVNSSALPTYAPAQKNQNVTFHITNHEAKQMNYTYAIVQDGVQLSRSTVTLSNGQGIDIPFSFMIAQPSSATQISVHLENRSEHIDFRSKS